MRTTLKRGIGRSPNNGALTRPVLPPPPINPVVLYEQPQPRSRFLVKAARGVMWLALGCAIVAAGVVGGAFLWSEEQLAGTAAGGVHATKTRKLLNVAHPDQPAVSLIIGVDQRAGVEHEDVTRSDTLMLVRADPGESSETSSVSMLSFPRDMRVPIYCPNQAPFEAKINAAFATCNVEGTVETVKALTGLEINYVVMVDFKAFKQVVGHLGGVWVDVDRRYYVPPDSGFAEIDIQPGYQKLSGNDALQYVRFRHYDSDLYRVARQQIFMGALKERFGELLSGGISSAFEFPRLVTAVTKNVKVIQPDGKAPSLDTAKQWASLMHDLPSGHLFKYQLKNFTEVGGTSDLAASSTELEELLTSFSAPDIEAADRAAEAAGIKRKAKQAAPRPEDTSVLVLNGSGVAGVAGNTASQLAAYGYEMVSPANGQAANAPRQNYFATQVYWNNAAGKDAQAAALQVGTLFLDSEMSALPPTLKSLAGKAKVVAVLGKTFDGQIPPAPPREEAPTKEAPNVTVRPDYTRDLLRSVRRTVPFQLMIPTRVDAGSYPAQASPVRSYRITKGHRAVRLTFSQAKDAGGYWGIEQTDWADAPAAKGTHITRKLQGKTFDFYYDGSHLKMVVYRTPKASYWVVNTLRNTLSNQTMLAIAKGLRPLSA